MALFDQWPYVNIHNLNTDWLVKTVKEVKDKTDLIDQSVSDAEQYAENAKTSEDNAKISEDNAKNSETSALNVLNNITTYTSTLSDRVNTNTQNIAVNSRRIDSFTTLAQGSTTGDAELIDARIWFDGDTSATAGDAIRGQASFLNDKIEEITGQVKIYPNILDSLLYETGKYYVNGYGNESVARAYTTYDPYDLEPNTTYTIRNMQKDFSWYKETGLVGVQIKTMASYIENVDGTISFTTGNTDSKLFLTTYTNSLANTFLVKGDHILFNTKQTWTEIPSLVIKSNTVKLYVSKTYNASTPGFGVDHFDSVISAVSSITDSSEQKPYEIVVQAGSAGNPVIYDDWSTIYGGHVDPNDSYVGLSLPSYLTITTTEPTHPDRTVFEFDGHYGINDTMTYDDAFKKCMFHILGNKRSVVIEGVTIRAQDCRYAIHPESGVDGYKVSWSINNCIIDWRGCPHSNESGWLGQRAIGVGLGYGGEGSFSNSKWIVVSGTTTAIGGHSNGWNPGVSQLPIMPGATIKIKNCDLANCNVLMQNPDNYNELNNIIEFYNVINCSGNNSTGWLEIKQACLF